jgi:hypothetical protein
MDEININQTLVKEQGININPSENININVSQEVVNIDKKVESYSLKLEETPNVVLDLNQTPETVLNFDGVIVNIDANYPQAVEAARIATEKAAEATQIVEGFDEHAQEKIAEYNSNASDKIAEYNQNATEKTNTFNSNATSKTTAYNDNASEKLSAYNTNDTEKTSAYNTNAQNKLDAYNLNDTSKTNAFNQNATDKTDAFNSNATAKTGDFNDNATSKTTAFNENATSKTTAFNENASEKQALVDASAQAASQSADEAKQWAIGAPSEPAGNSAKYWAGQAQAELSGLTSRVSTIEGKIPSSASSSNQLVDKNYVDTEDNNLQTQIDAIVSSSDVFDIVGTYAELQAYDISTVPVNDIIKVLVDSTHGGAATYYRCIETAGVKSWSYIGSEGAYYTKGEADSKFSTIPATGSSLDYTGTTLSLENAQGIVLSSVTIKSTPDLDNTTISLNSSSELQAIGTVNKNTATGATNPVYDWVGTLQEYETQQVETLHPDWICYITDDVQGGTSVYTKSEVDNLLSVKANSADVYTKTETDISISAAISTMLGNVYPVGSVYIGTTSTCPMASLISGSTWTLVSSGRVLQGADSNHAAGTTISAGLPNITGSLSRKVSTSHGTAESNGALSYTISGSDAASSGSSGKYGVISLNASNSNSIYGNSTTVQPPAYVVNIWQRTA